MLTRKGKRESRACPRMAKAIEAAKNLKTAARTLRCKSFVNLINQAIHTDVEQENRKISLRIRVANKALEIHFREVEMALQKLLEMKKHTIY
jgi:hypothetical protein